MALTSTDADEETVAQAAEQTTTDPAVLAAAGSVALSWYYFFARGERDMGVFVGLWPPTILAFASYFAQTDVTDKLDRAMGPGTGSSGVTQSVREMVGSK